MQFFNQALRRIGFGALRWSGWAAAAEHRIGARGAILRFRRVNPARREAFQPLRAQTVTPEFLDRAIAALRRWGYDIVAIGEVPGRLAETGARARIAVLTFDGGGRDFSDHAWPVLRRYRAPFTVYVPSAGPDGLALMAAPVIEQIVRTQTRVGLVTDSGERRLPCASLSEKREAFEVIAAHLQAIPDHDAADLALRDLCRRYGVNPGALCRAHYPTWGDLQQLAADPLATIGSATVAGAALSRMSAARAEQEMRMGRAVLETALGRPLPHFAFPGGRAETVRRRDVLAAAANGFATAVTAEHRPLMHGDEQRLHALPRLSIDGDVASLGYLRALLAGWGAQKASAVEPAVIGPDATSM